ncbi:MAG: Tim44/TimA family putative adaptor protein [Pseudomonadota bacterium]
MDPVLLIFIGLAGFVVFRLISVLGTRTGHEQQHDIEGLQRAARGETSDAEAADREPAERKPALQPVSEAAAPLREADPNFDESEYLMGARGAYEMIVEAFAAGDLKSIRQFLGASVFDTFKRAVDMRQSSGHTSELKFVGIESASIEASEVRDNALWATTAFTSNQVRATRDKDGNVIEGDPNRIDLVKDRWTFSRKLGSKDPNWVLVATGGA